MDAVRGGVRRRKITGVSEPCLCALDVALVDFYARPLASQSLCGYACHTGASEWIKDQVSGTRQEPNEILGQMLREPSWVYR